MPFLGEGNTEQFEVITEVNGREIGRQKIHDPFISTTVTIGWQDILRSLLFGLKIRVHVRATHAAQRRIMALDPVEMQCEENELLNRARQIIAATDEHPAIFQQGSRLVAGRQYQGGITQ